MSALNRYGYQSGDVQDVEIEVHRAGKIGRMHVPTFQISASTEIPERIASAETAVDNREIFERDATEIFEVLVGCLPGGTVDRLIAKLLQHKASDLVVASGVQQR